MGSCSESFNLITVSQTQIESKFILLNLRFKPLPALSPATESKNKVEFDSNIRVTLKKVLATYFRRQSNLIAKSETTRSSRNIKIICSVYHDKEIIFHERCLQGTLQKYPCPDSPSAASSSSLSSIISSTAETSSATSVDNFNSFCELFAILKCQPVSYLITKNDSAIPRRNLIYINLFH